jgi:hypothetical protein
MTGAIHQQRVSPDLKKQAVTRQNHARLTAFKRKVIA